MTATIGLRPRTTADRIEDLSDRLDQARQAGSVEAARRQYAKGKRTARERIDLLLDPDSFVETDALARQRNATAGPAARPYGDGVVTGHGTIDGRTVCVFAHDFTVFGGSLGEAFGEKVIKVMDLAARIRCPVIGINDSGGGRIQDGVVAQSQYGQIFYRNVRLSGIVPQISLIMGPCAGGAVYSPALTDFTVMVGQTSHMFVAGPNVIKAATGEDIGLEDLGGGRAHNARSGCAHHLSDSEDSALAYVRRLLSYLPANHQDHPPVRDCEPAPLGLTEADRELNRLVPDEARRAYDMRRVIQRVVDDGELLEIQPLFARNIIVGFARVEGRSVGVVANQPMHCAGCLDIDASEKAARFVRTCDAFNVPVVTFVDAPGFLPGADQERGGIIRRGAKLIYAYAESTVPKVTVVTRKAYGGAYVVMGSKHLGADVNLAWPTAEIAVMGADGAVSVLYRDQLRTAVDPDGERARLAREYADAFCNPYLAAERGYVDAVIPPSATRVSVVRALRALRTRQESPPERKHGNIPL